MFRAAKIHIISIRAQKIPHKFCDFVTCDIKVGEGSRGKGDLRDEKKTLLCMMCGGELSYMMNPIS